MIRIPDAAGKAERARRQKQQFRQLRGAPKSAKPKINGQAQA
ncbi:hypothetical protein ABQY58_016365 [Xanthomonas hortorum pv. hederae]